MDHREVHKSLLKQSFSPLLRPDGFTEADWAFLQKYGAWLHALMHGDIEPITKEQVHFIQVCNEMAPPISEPERIWKNYQNEVKSFKIIQRLVEKKISYKEAHLELTRFAMPPFSSSEARKWIDEERCKLEDAFARLERSVARTDEPYARVILRIKSLASRGNKLAKMWMLANAWRFEDDSDSKLSRKNTVWEKGRLHHVTHVFRG
jgi:uncharacterized protein YifE (UPF0438 family)